MPARLAPKRTNHWDCCIAQSEPHLPAIGRTAWAIRGPRSRAGSMAWPIVPPSERPMAQTRHPTRKGPRPAATPCCETAIEKIAPAISTRMKVAMISLMRFAAAFRMAGAVQNTPNSKWAFPSTRLALVLRRQRHRLQRDCQIESRGCLGRLTSRILVRRVRFAKRT
jgi:hypothetical protein